MLALPTFTPILTSVNEGMPSVFLWHESLLSSFLSHCSGHLSTLLYFMCIREGAKSFREVLHELTDVPQLRSPPRGRGGRIREALKAFHLSPGEMKLFGNFHWRATSRLSRSDGRWTTSSTAEVFSLFLSSPSLGHSSARKGSQRARLSIQLGVMAS